MDTLFECGEIVSPTAMRKGAEIELVVPRAYTSRRIYLFVDTMSAGDFVLYSTVVTRLGQTPIDEFPANLWSNTNGSLALNKSAVSLFSVGGSAVGDSIVVQLTNPFNANLPSIVAQPLRVDSEVDTIVWKLESFAGQVAGFRAWLGCISGKNQ